MYFNGCRFLFLCAFYFLSMFFPAFSGEIEQGSGRFIYKDYNGSDVREIPVYYHCPETLSKFDPILFIMHGNSRRVLRFWRPWKSFADKYKVLILAPEFDKYDFPGSLSYHSGGMYDISTGEEKPKNLWTFSLIEHIFDHTKTLTGSVQKKFFLYGHSAGAQFVHRYLTFSNSAKVARAVAANSGWYTLPSLDVEFPYGIGNSPANSDNLKTLFASHLTILLGDQDTRQTRNLRQTPEAMDQGPHRLARGKNYFRFGKRQADRHNLAFNWDIRIVPAVGHSNKEIAGVAADILLGTPRIR